MNKFGITDKPYITDCSFCKNKFNRNKDEHIVIYPHKGFKTEQFILCDKCTKKFKKDTRSAKWLKRNEF